MGAEFCIHVFDIDDEETIQHYIALNSSTIGSKYHTIENYDYYNRELDENGESRWDKAYHHLGNLESYDMGEVSWLKANLFDDNETYIPSPIEVMHDLIGEDFPVIDDEFIKTVKHSLGVVENLTGYATYEDGVVEFLEDNKGKRILYISW